VEPARISSKKLNPALNWRMKMFFKQIKVEGLGCLSYIIGCPKDGRAFVVDPKRDIDDYLKIADENGLKITGVIDTHVHADHISGSHELKAQTGATIFVHENADVEYEHSTLKDGDQIEIGNVKIDVVFTP
jgi:glyoxylase-like metal-dependent hydrolase (beta-lactamase superfamily II)